MSIPVLLEDGTPYTCMVSLKCTVNIGKKGQEIYHQVRPIRKKKLPEMLREATRRYGLEEKEAKILVYQDMSNTLTMLQRIKLLQEVMDK
jgi:hypothetical protein